MSIVHHETIESERAPLMACLTAIEQAVGRSDAAPAPRSTSTADAADPRMAAFAERVVAAYPALLRFGLKLTRDSDRAEDLAQETILRALAKAHLYSERGKLESWLLVILYKNFINAVRRAARARVSLFPAAMEESVAGRQEDHVLIGEVGRCLRLIPPEQAAVTLLVGRDGYSYDQAASLLNLSPTTVRSRLSRGRALLRRLLAEEVKPACEAGRP